MDCSPPLLCHYCATTSWSVAARKLPRVNRQADDPGLGCATPAGVGNI